MDTPSSKVSSSYFIAIFAILLIIAAFFISQKLEAEYLKVYLFTTNNIFLNTIAVIGSFFLLFNFLFLAYLSYLYFKYKPTPASQDSELPLCTVIIPAYNEGKLVYETLQSVIQSDYPAQKLEILVVDDGSTDDTWDWILKATEEFGNIIKAHKHDKNQGKRRALYNGFKIGSGEIFVTIDSDSIIEKNTIRLMVSPFIKNSNCGAVAGNVKIRNTHKAILPKMLHVRFVFSFEFLRAAHSTLGFVLCTPGALSAYSRKAIEPLLEPWITQKFLGKLSDIGEDRALTTLVFKDGWHVLFQKEAKVYTNIPENFKQLYRMFLRWERSNVRENIYMAEFAFKNFRKGNKIGERIIFIEQWIQLILAIPFIMAFILLLVNFPIVTIISTLIGCFFATSEKVTFYSLKHNPIEAIWAYSYSIFFAFTLFWVVPYSILSVKKGGWLTK